MVQTQITDKWVGGTSGKIRVDFKAGEDAGPLLFKSAINMLEADWDALTTPQQTALMETRYTNWVAQSTANANYVKTNADYREDLLNFESVRAKSVTSREEVKAAITNYSKADWQAEESLQATIEAEALAAKTEATTEAGKL